MSAAWITVVGLGEDGRDGLSAMARAAIDRAAHLVGSERHMGLVGPVSGKTHIWPTPLEDLFADVESWRGAPTVILATGDPMTFGIGKKLLSRFSRDDMVVLPQASAFSLAAARLGWALQDVDTLSLHARPVSLIEPLIQPGNRIMALTNDRTTIPAVAERLCRRGFGDSHLTVLEHMNGRAERFVSFAARDLSAQSVFADFQTLAIECAAAPGAGAIIRARVPGLPDLAFQHDGQLTKREVRAATLAALAPAPNRLLWDIGAGCGSIAIEWVRSARHARAICFEQIPERLALISANADALGAPAITLVPGAAPASLDGQPAPDTVFIGGGLTTNELFDQAWRNLKPGGNLVANTVTLEGDAFLISLQERLGGELVRIEISHLEQLGSRRGLRPRMPVLQWRIDKPW